MIEAKPASENPKNLLLYEYDMVIVKRSIEHFVKACAVKMEMWKEKFTRTKKCGEKVVLWGGGSKGVAFLTTLGIEDEIEYAVDINPHKRGTFMAGTGQQIVTPDFLKDYKPDVVIIMNPIYKNEILKDLLEMQLSPEILCV